MRVCVCACVLFGPDFFFFFARIPSGPNPALELQNVSLLHLVQVLEFVKLPLYVLPRLHA